ncbi:MAG: DUF6364 family protein [Ferruginibacter sp.]
MNTKLTLNINRKILEDAKKAAARRKKSLSKMVEGYLQQVAATSTGSIVDEIIQMAPSYKSVATPDKEIIKSKKMAKYSS